MRNPKCQWCKQRLSASALRCAACGMPGPLYDGPSLKPPADKLMIATSISFIAFLFAGTLSWFGMKQNWLMSVSLIALSALVILLLVRRWKKRLPLLYRGSELDFDERPMAYHLCTFALIFFAAVVHFAGLRMAVDDIRSMKLNTPTNQAVGRT